MTQEIPISTLPLKATYFNLTPQCHTIYILKWGRKKKALPTTLKQFYIILQQIPTIYN
jgi:hypothetical protein